MQHFRLAGILPNDKHCPTLIRTEAGKTDTERERFYTISEAAQLLKVSDQSIRRWVKAGELKAYKPKKEYRIAESDLQEFLEGRAVPLVQAPLPQSSRERRAPELDRPFVWDAEAGELVEKPAPANGPEERREGWQSIARVRSELLEGAAELWDAQLDKGQYDWQTLKAIESLGFRIALNHALEEKEMKRWLTPEQLAQLERAEKRYEAHADRIVGMLRNAAEEEKKRLSEADVINLERYVAEREAAHRELSITA